MNISLSRWYLVCFLFSLPAWCPARSAICISGTVKDAADNPVAGAVITLAVEGSSVTSDHDGRFAIDKTNAIRIPHGSHVSRPARLHNGRLAVPVSGNTRITIKVFDIRGRRVLSAADAAMPAGTHEFLLSSLSLSDVLYFVLINAGESVTVLKYMPAVGSGSYAGILPAASRCAKSLAVVDSLRASKSGFETQSKPISSYIDTIDFVLQTVSVNGLILRPPVMSKPHVVHAQPGKRYFPADDPNKSGLTFSTPKGECYNEDQDVIIFGHSTEQTFASIHIYGGRHVRWIGGRYNQCRINCNDQFGSAFVEGVHIDMQGSPDDAIVTRYHQDVFDAVGSSQNYHGGLYVQNCLIENVTGSAPGEGTTHGDGIQGQGPTLFFRIEQLTIETNEQAVFIPNQWDGTPREWCFIRNCNTRWVSINGAQDYARSYWFYDGSKSARDMGTDVHPWILDNVWAEDNSTADDTNPAQCVYPQPNFDWGPTLASDSIGDFLEFPDELLIDGIVRKGQTPNGDFMKPDMCGLDFVSPWPVPR